MVMKSLWVLDNRRNLKTTLSGEDLFHNFLTICKLKTETKLQIKLHSK